VATFVAPDAGAIVETEGLGAGGVEPPPEVPVVVEVVLVWLVLPQPATKVRRNVKTRASEDTATLALADLDLRCTIHHQID
jgi:hypothetical protein